MKGKKQESEEILTGKHPLKVTISNPADKLAEQKRMDKLNSMRIALTYIEGQGMMKVTPKKAIEIADEFLEWLKK